MYITECSFFDQEMNNFGIIGLQYIRSLVYYEVTFVTNRFCDYDRFYFQVF